MNQLEFAPITEADLAEVTEIYNYYVQHSTATFHTRPLTTDEMYSILFYPVSVYATYVMKQEGRIVGYCGIRPFHQREAYAGTAEMAVYLRHDETGKGAGREAVQYLERQALDNDIHVLISCICAENTGSIKLCENMGYEKCGHFKEVGVKFGRLLDVVYYQKLLDER